MDNNKIIPTCFICNAKMIPISEGSNIWVCPKHNYWINYNTFLEMDRFFKMVDNKLLFNK